MISFASAPGNLYNVLGKIALMVKNLRSYQGTLLTTMTDTTNGVVAQLNSESDIQAIMGGAYIGIESSTDSSIGSTVQSLAAATVNRKVFRDNPQLGQTLTNANTTASIQEVIRQMKLAGATVLNMTVGITPPAAFTGGGNGVMVASAKRPLDGLVLENSYAETLTVVCSSDSYSGGATAGNEGFTVTGAGSQSDVFAFNWPLGSGASSSLQAINGNSSNSNNNILANSGFDNWTAAGIPNNFVLVTGAAGTNINQETSLVYDGAAAIRLTGDASNTLTQWTQQFNSGAGTSTSLTPQTQYAFNVFLRRDGVAAGQGILAIDLVDNNNNTIKDANGAANTFNIDLTALTTVYAPFNVAFRTPVVLPATQSLRFRLTTSLTNNRSVYIDKAAMGLMTQIYTSGPFLANFSGSIPYVFGDYMLVPVTNSRGAGGTLDSFQCFCSRALPQIISNEFLLPSSPTPTLSDAALIS